MCKGEEGFLAYSRRDGIFKILEVTTMIIKNKQKKNHRKAK
jgi:hypothetical protein